MTLAISLATGAYLGRFRGPLSEPGTYSVSAYDPRMEHAMKSGRASLPGFWERFAHPDPQDSGFSVKAMRQTLPSSDEKVIHINGGLMVIRRINESLICTIL